VSAVRPVAAATQSLALIQQSTRDHTRIARAIAARDAERAALHLDHIEETTRAGHEGGIDGACPPHPPLSTDPAAAGACASLVTTER
jgi:hypothetical protein